jgi:hypothetical protein
VDGRRNASGGRGQGQQHEREDRLPGVHHEHDQIGGRISECRYTFPSHSYFERLLKSIMVLEPILTKFVFNLLPTSCIYWLTISTGF